MFDFLRETADVLDEYIGEPMDAYILEKAKELVASKEQAMVNHQIRHVMKSLDHDKIMELMNPTPAIDATTPVA